MTEPQPFGKSFTDALEGLVTSDDDAQVVLGHIIRRAYNGVMTQKAVQVFGPEPHVEVIDVLEINLETARKAVDSLLKRQQQNADNQPIAGGGIQIGFVVDDSLPAGVLDPYIEDDE